MNWLKNLLNRWTGAAARIRGLHEQLNACEQHVRILRHAHVPATAEESRLIAALRAPDRWQPDEPITELEAKEWGALLRSPLLRKIDLAMVNMAQQQAQQAIHAPTADTIRAAGYAAGFRGAWQLAKSLSTLAGADTGKPETTPPTDDVGLDHLNP